jgi:methyltransferase FkbM-like protein
MNEVLETVDSANSYIKVRSEVGDPVQLSDVRPVACELLTRIGSRYDGGYVVPLDAVRAARALVSFGLSHDWTFERDFKNHNPDAVIHCYDHTVSLRTAFQYSIGQLLRFVLLFRTSSFRKIFTWIDYKVFFQADRIHFRQRIWRDNQNNSATIDDVFSRLPREYPVFVKMDIEGGEYSVLDDLLRHSRNIVSMAIEFHDLDTRSSLFNSFIEKIKRDFHIVHIHGNNLGGMTSSNFPIATEITFLNKRFFNSPPSPSRLEYPISGLDRPNHPRLPEFSFEF